MRYDDPYENQNGFDPYGPGGGSYEQPQPPIGSLPPSTVPQPPITPPSTTTTPPPNTTAGPGGMDPNQRPTTDPGPGRVWKFDPANGWYSSGNYSDEGPGGGGTGKFDPYASGMGGNAPKLAYPDYESAGIFQPRNATFSFDPYGGSSWQDAEQEPGYAASRNQLRKQIEAGAAYRGMARSGMTIGDLYTNLDALGQQNFKQFDDRKYRDWSGNRDLAATKFGLEYGVDRDVYDRKATDVDRSNNYKFNTADASFKDALARWTEMTRSLTTLARPV